MDNVKYWKIRITAILRTRSQALQTELTGSTAYQLSVLALIVALELPPEGDGGQPQDLGRLRPVAAAGPEDLLDVLRLQLLERAERLRHRRRGRRWAVPQIRRQVRESDRLSGLPPNQHPKI